MEENTPPPVFLVNFQPLPNNTYKIFITNDLGTIFSSIIQGIPRPPTNEECLEWFKTQFDKFFIEA